jgi:peptide/nickel transport system substrate-binding protein
VWCVAVLAAACSGGGGKPSGLSTTESVTTTTQLGRQGGTLNVAELGAPHGFNVNTRADNDVTTRDIMERVWPSAFHVTPDLKVEQDKYLIDSAAVTGQNPQTVVIKINPQATWSDGVPITADDFIYFWKQQRDPAHTTDSCTDTACTSNGQPVDVTSDGTGYRDIQSITGTDGGKTVTMVFSPSFADWRSLWSHMPPAHLAQKVGWNKGFDNFDPNVIVSGGPWRLGTYVNGGPLTLVPNDRYWGKRARLDSIIFHFYGDAGQQVAALQAKQIDVLGLPATSPDVTNIKNLPDMNSEVKMGLSFEQVLFNARSPGLDDVAVRKALAIAVDRPAMMRQAVGPLGSNLVVDSNRFFVPDQPVYQDGSGGAYDHGDPAKAKQLLQQAGYMSGGDGVLAKGGRRLSVRVLSAASDGFASVSVGGLAGSLRAAGVGISTETVPDGGALIGRLGAHDFDLAVFAVDGSMYPSYENPWYVSGGGRNYGAAGNAQLDDLLFAGAGSLDAGQQAGDYNQADKIIWDNMWSLPLYQVPSFLAVRNTVLNVHANPPGESLFWNSETWALVAAAQ